MLNRNQGFTLIELLTALSILAILVGLAAPAASSMIKTADQRAHIDQLLSHLNFARSRAITSRQTVTLCAGEASCNGDPHWRGQILVFADSNMNGQLDAGEQLLQVSRMSATHNWYWGNFRNQRHMSFKPDGTTHSLNGTFTLCRQNEALRTIVINVTGRIRLDSPANNNNCT